MSFYNTTNESGESLFNNKAKSDTQNDVVLSLFKNNSERKMSASMVHALSGLNCPLTSIRRSISNLTNEGLLEKTNIKVSGKYGRAEYTWAYSKI